MRDGLSAGMLDYNSVYKSVGLLGRNVIEVEMSGAEIAGYFSAMQTLQNEMPEWAGFRVRRVEGVPKPQLVPEISASRRYRVALPLREWEQRVMRLARAKRDVPGDALGAMARTPPLRLTKLGLSVFPKRFSSSCVRRQRVVRLRLSSPNSLSSERRRSLPPLAETNLPLGFTVLTEIAHPVRRRGGRNTSTSVGKQRGESLRQSQQRLRASVVD